VEGGLLLARLLELLAQQILVVAEAQVDILAEGL
jgi:hypothetical protein